MNLAALLPQLTENVLVLTPNRRLCVFLTDHFNQWQLQQQKTTWPSLQAFPIGEWLQQLWSNGFQQQETLLDNEQLAYVWQQIILTHSDTAELLKLDATVKQAIEAMRMLILWQVPLTEKEFTAELDWRQFYQWLNAYLNHCRQHNYTDIHQIPKKILQALEQQSPPAFPEKIILFGFDELPPLWQTLLEKLKSFTNIQTIDLLNDNQHKQRIEFTNFNAELTAMIEWSRQQYAENPKQTIACIVPSLATKRASIEKAFIKAFAPEIFLELKDKDSVPFNISAGQALATFEIINSALKILQLNLTQLTMAEIKLLLRNPFIIGYYKEYAQRAALEVIITKLQNYSLPYNYFLKLLQQYCPILALQLQKFANLQQPEKTSILVWINYFNKKLELLGWPGERELSSQNYQLVLRFKNLFTEMLNLEILIDKCTCQQALTLIIKRANNTIFQVKTEKKSIQILGSLEAAGMIFDKIWLMEMNDKQWPAAANPNPFIPHVLQRNYQLPHANADRELNFSQLLLKRYFNSAKEIYLSYAKEDGEYEYHCSSLIDGIPLIKNETMPTALIDNSHSDLEILEDNQAPTIDTIELTKIKGGSRILKTQAVCPFQAFAKHRLGLEMLPAPQPGLTALERGNIIHAALDIFWQQLKTQTALKQLSEENKNALVHSAAQAALISIHLPLYQTSPKFYQLELQRVTHLINQWLEFEKKREHFQVIATEKALQLEFAQLPLKVRIDRIDQLDNGALLLIDYKTNDISIERWFDQRLDEPQLPLYALIYPNAIAGIIFGQIKANNLAVKGVGNAEAAGYGVKPILWNEQMQQWRQVLQQLTTDFINGVAVTDPKNGKQSCEQCGLESVCRIGESHE